MERNPTATGTRGWVCAAVLGLGLALLAASDVGAEHLGPQDRDCRHFRTWQEAQAFFEAAGPGDPHHLDSDKDGIACESLPGAPPPDGRTSPASRIEPTPTPTPAPTATPTPTETLAPAQPSPAPALRTTPPTPTASPTPPAAAPAEAPSPPPPAASPPPGRQVWLLVLAATEIYSEPALDGADPPGRADAGRWYEVLELREGWAAVRLEPGGVATGWIVVDSRVQLVSTFEP